jgi:hypothetical protein
METVPVTEMLCFLGVPENGKCLQAESLTYLIKIHSVIRCICKIVKSDYHLHHVCLLGMTQLPVGVFFNEISGGKSAEKLNFHYSQTRVTVLPVKQTNLRICSYLAQFLESEMFQTKVVKKIKTHFIYSNFFKKITVLLIR